LGLVGDAVVFCAGLGVSNRDHDRSDIEIVESDQFLIVGVVLCIVGGALYALKAKSIESKVDWGTLSGREG
jgi:hypothetical protein